MSGTAASRTSNRVQIPQFGIDVYDRLVYFSPFDRAVLEGSFWSAKNQLATFLSPPPRRLGALLQFRVYRTAALPGRSGLAAGEIGGERWRRLDRLPQHAFPEHY